MLEGKGSEEWDPSWERGMFQPRFQSVTTHPGSGGATGVALHEMVRLFKNRPFHCRKSETVTPLTLIFAANVRLQSWIGCAH